MRIRCSFTLAALACVAVATPGAEGSEPPPITADPHASASAVVPNKITVDVPATVKAGKSFLAQADAQLDKRLHKPPYDYLKAGLFSTKGTTRCPRAVPVSRRGWDTVATFDYGQSRSVRTEFGTSLTLDRPGRYRFCAYIYIATPSRKVGSFSETLRVKARASKLVRARAA